MNALSFLSRERYKLVVVAPRRPRYERSVRGLLRKNLTSLHRPITVAPGRTTPERRGGRQARKPCQSGELGFSACRESSPHVEHNSHTAAKDTHKKTKKAKKWPSTIATHEAPRMTHRPASLAVFVVGFQSKFLAIECLLGNLHLLLQWLEVEVVD